LAAKYFGSDNMKKNANKLNKMLERSRNIGEIFKHFTTNEWIFSAAKLNKIESELSSQDRATFNFDSSHIIWYANFAL
jgi:hypothetical protein